MAPASRIEIALKAATQLGIRQAGLFALYRIGLLTGHYQRTCNAALSRLAKHDQQVYFKLYPLFSSLPNRAHLNSLLDNQVGVLLEQADEIVSGQVRLFGN